MKNVLLLLATVPTIANAKSQVICATGKDASEAVMYLNQKIEKADEFIVFDVMKYDKDLSKNEKKLLQGVIKPKHVSAPSITETTACVTVTD